MDFFEKPSIKIVEEKDTEDGKCVYGKYVIQPLIRGFGITLGNSLRRILLSAIYGSAVVYLKIDSVLHEFSALDGVYEDVTDIILNLKRLPVNCKNSGLVTLILDKSGKGEVIAADLAHSEEVEISDPEYHIAEIVSNNTKLKMEIGVKKGFGYVPSEWHEHDTEVPKERGVILIDSNFSPVKKVKFSVESSRVGQRTGFDKLLIELETNKSIGCADCLSQAARILMNQASFVVDFKTRILLEVEKQREEEKKKTTELKRTIEDLDLSVRSYNCLKNAGILAVEELIKSTETRLKGLRNFGEKSLREIKTKLLAMGLSLAEDE